MKKNDEYTEPKVTLLTDFHNEAELEEAEEYVQDHDQVYRKKEEVETRTTTGSVFLARLICLLGLTAVAFVFCFKVLRLVVNSIQAAMHAFKNMTLNYQVLKNLHECFAFSKVILGLGVGVINPNWGKKLMSLFFSVTDKKYSHPMSSFIFSI